MFGGGARAGTALSLLQTLPPPRPPRVPPSARCSAAAGDGECRLAHLAGLWQQLLSISIFFFFVVESPLLRRRCWSSASVLCVGSAAISPLRLPLSSPPPPLPSPLSAAMSLKAELQRVRAAGGGLTAGRPTPPPSLLFSARIAAAQPLAEVAELGAAGLAQLATVDARLGALSESLYLSPSARAVPLDRSLLDAPAAAALARSVRRLAALIGPVFPLAATQQVLEWAVRGLRVDLYATAAEVDALLLAGARW